MKTGLIMAGALSGALLLAFSVTLAADDPPADPKASPTPAAAQATTPGRGATTTPAVNGEPLWRTRCAGCHEPAQDRAPTRADLANRTPEYVFEALTRGIMQPMADGLGQNDMRAIATYVTGKQFAPVPRFGAGVAQPDVMCRSHPPIRMTATSWNGWGFDLRNTRMQPNGGLAAADVPRLKLKWAFSYKGGRYGQPTVIGDWLFTSSSGGQVYALDAKTGCVHWRRDIEGGSRQTLFVERRPGVSPSGWVAYFGDWIGGYVYAVDAQTGRDVWKVRIEDHEMGRLGGAPIVYKDKLYIPTSSHEEVTTRREDYRCCTFRGAVVALDVRTGRQLWKTYMVSDPPRPTRRTPDGHQNYGPAGAAIWGAPAVDVKRNSLYVTTGDSYTEINAPMSDAIVALDLDTGRIKWHFQATEADNYMGGCGGEEAARPPNCPRGVIGRDIDFGAGPLIATLANGRDVVLAGQKSSDVWAVDADTGRKLWMTNVGGGGALGGIEWGIASDGRTLYVPNSDVSAQATRARPGLYAIDIGTGAVRWEIPAPRVNCNFFSGGRCSNAQSAPASLIPGVVFSGTMDGRLRAYQMTDGKVIWEYDTTAQRYDTVNGVKGQPGGSIDSTGAVIAGGMVYTMSGYDGSVRTGGNDVNVLLAFSVDGK